MENKKHKKHSIQEWEQFLQNHHKVNSDLVMPIKFHKHNNKKPKIKSKIYMNQHSKSKPVEAKYLKWINKFIKFIQDKWFKNKKSPIQTVSVNEPTAQSSLESNYNLPKKKYQINQQAQTISDKNNQLINNIQSAYNKNYGIKENIRSIKSSKKNPTISLNSYNPKQNELNKLSVSEENLQKISDKKKQKRIEHKKKNIKSLLTLSSNNKQNSKRIEHKKKNIKSLLTLSNNNKQRQKINSNSYNSKQHLQNDILPASKNVNLILTKQSNSNDEIYIRNWKKKYDSQLTIQQKKLQPSFKSNKHKSKTIINNNSKTIIDNQPKYYNADNGEEYQKIKNTLYKNNPIANVTQVFKINDSKQTKLASAKNDYKIKLTKKRFIYVFGDDKKNDAYFKLISDGQMSISLIPKWETLLFWHTKISLLTRLPMIFGAILLIIAFILYKSNSSYMNKYHLNIILFMNNLIGNQVNESFIKKYSVLIYLLLTFLYWIMFILPITFFKRRKIILNICYYSLGINFIYLIWIVFSYIFYDEININIISSMVIELLGIILLILSNSSLLFLLKK